MVEPRSIDVQCRFLDASLDNSLWGSVRGRLRQRRHFGSGNRMVALMRLWLFGLLLRPFLPSGPPRSLAPLAFVWLFQLLWLAL